nr:MAG TPA: hypothetical protein [Caudoviricetes sp.]
MRRFYAKIKKEPLNHWFYRVSFFINDKGVYRKILIF